MKKYNKKQGVIIAAISTGFALGNAIGEEQELIENQSDWLSGDRFGAGLHAGTSGFGGHITYEVYEWLYLKGQLTGFSYDGDEEIDDVNYDAEISLLSGGISANFIPFSDQAGVDGFRISLGLFGVDNNLDISASSPGESIDLGDAETFVLGAGDTLDGEGSFSALAPYVGFGWDWVFGSDDQFTFTIDAGVLFVGEPDVDLTATGAFADFAAQNPGLDLQAEIDKEIESIKDDIDGFEYYPVFSLGFTWGF